MATRILAALSLAVPLAIGLPGPAAAGDVPSRIGEARLVSEVKAVRPGSPFWVALRLRLAEGWHTYWRNPGDAGIETAIAWTLPDGYSAGPIQWPAPGLFRTGPIASYGYAGEVWLLTEVVPAAGAGAGGRAVLRADAQWLACEDICVPERASLELVLPVADPGAPTPAADAGVAAGFDRARAALPIPAPWPVTLTATDDDVSLAFAAAALAGRTADETRFFPAEFGVIDHAAPQRVRVDGGVARLTVARDSGSADLPDPVEGVLVIGEPDGRRAYAVRALPARKGSRP